MRTDSFGSSVKSIYYSAHTAKDLHAQGFCRRCHIITKEGGLKGLKYLIPRQLRSWIRLRYQRAGRGLLVFDRVTDWKVLRRVQPYRPDMGRRRGKCIDRYYIEKFLATHQKSIRGTVAEIGSDEYTLQFGGGRVERSEVLDINEGNARRTITLDLAATDKVPESVFDCILCTQTLFQIYDYAAAVRSLYKLLKPGGVLLATVPGISQEVRGGMLGGAGCDWWRFTGRATRRVFGDIFKDENVTVRTFGNVLTASAFLHGLVQDELTETELDYHDPDYEVTIGVEATKVGAKQAFHA